MTEKTLPQKSTENKITLEIEVEKGVKLPVTVINGKDGGKTMLLTAGINGGDYLGMRAAALLAKTLTPQDVRGSVIILHCCNPSVFFAYCPFVVQDDGKNLYTTFPGDSGGTLAEKIAHLIANAFVSVADFHVDVHCGDIPETLVSHACYIDDSHPEINQTSLEMAMASGSDYVFPFCGIESSLSHYACSQGIPSILIERGASGLWSEEEAKIYYRQLRGILANRGFIAPEKPLNKPKMIYEVFCLTASQNGCWLPQVELGDHIQAEEELGVITDFFGKTLETVVAAHDGVVLYMTSSLLVNKDGPLVTYGYYAH